MQEVYQCTPHSCRNNAQCTPVITVRTWMMTPMFSPLLLHADACILTQMYSATIPAFPCRCCTLLQCPLLPHADAIIPALHADAVLCYNARFSRMRMPASPACRRFNPCITCRCCTLLQCPLLPHADAIIPALHADAVLCYNACFRLQTL